MAFMLALVFIFEIVQKEVEALTRPKEGIVGAQDLEHGPSASDAPQAQGHSVALPPQATENGRPLNDVYAEVTGKQFASSMQQYSGEELVATCDLGMKHPAANRPLRRIALHIAWELECCPGGGHASLLL